MIIVTNVERIKMRLQQIEARRLSLEATSIANGQIPPYYFDQYLKLSDERVKLQFALNKKQGVV